MKVEINLRLDLKSGGGTPAAINERCRDVIEALDTYIITKSFRRIEDMLWIGFDYRGDIRNLRAILTVLCVKAGQECIAVYYPEGDVGELVGPWAYAWGEFDINFFITEGDLP